jgi:hypothetical protein
MAVNRDSDAGGTAAAAADSRLGPVRQREPASEGRPRQPQAGPAPAGRGGTHFNWPHRARGASAG